EIQAQQRGRPQTGRDHVIAIDQRGSMEKVWRKVQAQPKAYVSSQVRGGDTFSLFAFTDRPELLGTWHVAGEADREEIQKRMNDLHPLPRSYTVFSPLLPVIINHLKATALPEHEQVVLVVSDGERKRPPGFQGEDVPFQ